MRFAQTESDIVLTLSCKEFQSLTDGSRCCLYKREACTTKAYPDIAVLDVFKL